MICLKMEKVLLIECSVCSMKCLKLLQDILPYVSRIE